MAVDVDLKHLRQLLQALRSPDDPAQLRCALEQLGPHLTTLPHDLQCAVELYVLNLPKVGSKPATVSPELQAAVGAYLDQCERALAGLRQVGQQQTHKLQEKQNVSPQQEPDQNQQYQQLQQPYDPVATYPAECDIRQQGGGAHHALQAPAAAATAEPSAGSKNQLSVQQLFETQYLTAVQHQLSQDMFEQAQAAAGHDTDDIMLTQPLLTAEGGADIGDVATASEPDNGRQMTKTEELSDQQHLTHAAAHANRSVQAAGEGVHPQKHQQHQQLPPVTSPTACPDVIPETDPELHGITQTEPQEDPAAVVALPQCASTPAVDSTADVVPAQYTAEPLPREDCVQQASVDHMVAQQPAGQAAVDQHTDRHDDTTAQEAPSAVAAAGLTPLAAGQLVMEACDDHQCDDHQQYAQPAVDVLDADMVPATDETPPEGPWQQQTQEDTDQQLTGVPHCPGAVVVNAPDMLLRCDVESVQPQGPQSPAAAAPAAAEVAPQAPADQTACLQGAGLQACTQRRQQQHHTGDCRAAQGAAAEEEVCLQQHQHQQQQTAAAEDQLLQWGHDDCTNSHPEGQQEQDDEPVEDAAHHGAGTTPAFHSATSEPLQQLKVEQQQQHQQGDARKFVVVSETSFEQQRQHQQQHDLAQGNHDPQQQQQQEQQHGEQSYAERIVEVTVDPAARSHHVSPAAHDMVTPALTPLAAAAADGAVYGPSPSKWSKLRQPASFLALARKCVGNRGLSQRQQRLQQTVTPPIQHKRKQSAAGKQPALEQLRKPSAAAQQNKRQRLQKGEVAGADGSDHSVILISTSDSDTDQVDMMVLPGSSPTQQRRQQQQGRVAVAGVTHSRLPSPAGPLHNSGPAADRMQGVQLPCNKEPHAAADVQQQQVQQQQEADTHPTDKQPVHCKAATRSKGSHHSQQRQAKPRHIQKQQPVPEDAAAAGAAAAAGSFRASLQTVTGGATTASKQTTQSPAPAAPVALMQAAALRMLMAAAAAARLEAVKQAAGIGGAAAPGGGGSSCQQNRPAIVPVLITANATGAAGAGAAARQLPPSLPSYMRLPDSALPVNNARMNSNSSVAAATAGPKKLPVIPQGAEKASVREVVASAVAGSSSSSSIVKIPRIVPASFRVVNEAAVKFVREAKQQVQQGKKLKRQREVKADKQSDTTGAVNVRAAVAGTAVAAVKKEAVSIAEDLKVQHGRQHKRPFAHPTTAVQQTPEHTDKSHKTKRRRKEEQQHQQQQQQQQQHAEQHDATPAAAGEPVVPRTTQLGCGATAAATALIPTNTVKNTECLTSGLRCGVAAVPHASALPGRPRSSVLQRQLDARLKEIGVEQQQQTGAEAHTISLEAPERAAVVATLRKEQQQPQHPGCAPAAAVEPEAAGASTTHQRSKGLVQQNSVAQESAQQPASAVNDTAAAAAEQDTPQRPAAAAAVADGDPCKGAGVSTPDPSLPGFSQQQWSNAWLGLAVAAASAAAGSSGGGGGGGSGSAVLHLALGSQLLLPFTQPIQGLEQDIDQYNDFSFGQPSQHQQGQQQEQQHADAAEQADKQGQQQQQQSGTEVGEDAAALDADQQPVQSNQAAEQPYTTAPGEPLASISAAATSKAPRTTPAAAAAAVTCSDTAGVTPDKALEVIFKTATAAMEQDMHLMAQQRTQPAAAVKASSREVAAAAAVAAADPDSAAVPDLRAHNASGEGSAAAAATTEVASAPATCLKEFLMSLEGSEGQVPDWLRPPTAAGVERQQHKQSQGTEMHKDPVIEKADADRHLMPPPRALMRASSTQQQEAEQQLQQSKVVDAGGAAVSGGSMCSLADWAATLPGNNDKQRRQQQRQHQHQQQQQQQQGNEIPGLDKPVEPHRQQQQQQPPVNAVVPPAHASDPEVKLKVLQQVAEGLGITLPVELLLPVLQQQQQQQQQQQRKSGHCAKSSQQHKDVVAEQQASQIATAAAAGSRLAGAVANSDLGNPPPEAVETGATASTPPDLPTAPAPAVADVRPVQIAQQQQQQQGSKVSKKRSYTGKQKAALLHVYSALQAMAASEDSSVSLSQGKTVRASSPSCGVTVADDGDDSDAGISFAPSSKRLRSEPNSTTVSEQQHVQQPTAGSGQLHVDTRLGQRQQQRRRLSTVVEEAEEPEQSVSFSFACPQKSTAAAGQQKGSSYTSGCVDSSQKAAAAGGDFMSPSVAGNAAPSPAAATAVSKAPVAKAIAAAGHGKPAVHGPAARPAQHLEQQRQQQQQSASKGPVLPPRAAAHGAKEIQGVSFKAIKRIRHQTPNTSITRPEPPRSSPPAGAAAAGVSEDTGSNASHMQQHQLQQRRQQSVPPTARSLKHQLDYAGGRTVRFADIAPTISTAAQQAAASHSRGTATSDPAEYIDAMARARSLSTWQQQQQRQQQPRRTSRTLPPALSSMTIDKHPHQRDTRSGASQPSQAQPGQLAKKLLQTEPKGRQRVPDAATNKAHLQERHSRSASPSPPQLAAAAAADTSNNPWSVERQGARHFSGGNASRFLFGDITPPVMAPSSSQRHPGNSQTTRMETSANTMSEPAHRP